MESLLRRISVVLTKANKMATWKLRTYLLRIAVIPIAFAALFVKSSWSLGSTTAFIIESSGYLLILTGLAIRMWCTFYRENPRAIEFVTTGPYSICRNPFYIGYFLLTAGAGLFFENPLMLLLVLGITIPFIMATIWMEEAHMELLLGESYQEYKKNIARFWPRLSHYKSPDRLNVRVGIVRQVAIEVMIVVLLVEIKEVLEILRARGVLPILWHFP